jgi:pilus assembly protein CpaB
MLRRGLAMACAVTATLGVVSIARAPRGGPLVPVVVAARELGTGTELTPPALRVTRWPAALVPAGAVTSPAEVTGRRLNSSLGPGEVVTVGRVRGSGLLTGQPAGTRAVHVTLTDPGATAMVQLGDEVDLVGPHGVVALAVRVLQLDPGPQSGPRRLMGAGSLGAAAGGGGGPGGLVVAVDESDAKAIAAVPADAMDRPVLTLVLRAS